MAAKNFADDGAAGAFGGSGSGPQNSSQASPTQTAPGTSASPATAGSTAATPNPIGQQELATGQEAAFAPVTSTGTMTPQQQQTTQQLELATGMNAMVGGGVGSSWSLASGGAVPGYADGGAIDDSDTDDSNGSPQQNQMTDALNSVQQVMNHIYSKYGLSDGGAGQGGGTQAPAQAPSANGDGASGNYANFRQQSQDVEDRTQNDPTAGNLGTDTGGAYMAHDTKGGELLGRAQTAWQGLTNPMSQQAGLNDINVQQAQQNNQQEQGAIPDTEQQ